MKEIIGEGQTLDEATENALERLNATREEVEIEPLTSGSKGFLGFGRKHAQVKACLRADDRIRATVFMRNLLSHMGIDSPIEVKEEGENITIILQEDAAPLIGHHGQTLDALQYLVARFLNEDKEEWKKVVIDIDNYREKREENLKSMALRMADQAVKSKRDQKTDPLSPPERRIIHMVLKENNQVNTFSIGNSTHKRVVIALADRSDSGGGKRRSSSRRGDSGRGGRSSGGRGGGRGKGRSGGSGRGGNYSGKKSQRSHSSNSERPKSPPTVIEPPSSSS